MNDGKEQDARKMGGRGREEVGKEPEVIEMNVEESEGSQQNNVLR